MGQIIYWSNLSEFPSEIMKPKPLLKDIADSQSEHKGGNWVACPAISTKHKNTFLTTFPRKVEIDFEKQPISDDNLVSERTGLYKNSRAFDWDIKRIFFSAEHQVLEVSPAFLHQTSYAKYGHAPSGAFDISKWFRPSFPTFQLWEGENCFSAEMGEPHLYYNFPNSERVVLKEFSMTETLYKIMNACLDYKTHSPKQTLNTMYQDFAKAGARDFTLSEINKSLI